MRLLLLLALATRCSSLRVARRRFHQSLAGAAAAAAFPRAAGAAADSTPAADLALLRRGLADLEALVDNWQERTVNCKYAEVNRGLLETSAKQELLVESTKNALVVKNSKAVKTLCKRDPEVVRQVMGLDGKLNAKGGPPAAFAPGASREIKSAAADPNSPLVDADRMIKRGLKTIDDDLEAYIEAEELWLQAISTVDAASYTSGSADFGSIVSTASDGSAKDSALLEDARRGAIQARDALRCIVGILAKASKA
mgnify:FL=1